MPDLSRQAKNISRDSQHLVLSSRDGVWFGTSGCLSPDPPNDHMFHIGVLEIAIIGITLTLRARFAYLQV